MFMTLQFLFKLNALWKLNNDVTNKTNVENLRNII